MCVTRWVARYCAALVAAVALFLAVAEAIGLIRRVEGASKPNTLSLLVWGLVAVACALACFFILSRTRRAAKRVPRQAPTAVLILGTTIGSFGAIAVGLTLVIAVVNRIAGDAKPAVGAIVLMFLLAVPLGAIPVACLRGLRSRWSGERG
jgi:hypothetical protein